MSCNDVLFVKQKDGGFKSSPFFVRFKKSTKKKQKVAVFIDTVDCGVKMTLKENEKHCCFEENLLDFFEKHSIDKSNVHLLFKSKRKKKKSVVDGKQEIKQPSVPKKTISNVESNPYRPLGEGKKPENEAHVVGKVEEKKMEKKSRTGILGKVKNLLIGKKKVAKKVQIVEEEDSSVETAPENKDLLKKQPSNPEKTVTGVQEIQKQEVEKGENYEKEDKKKIKEKKTGILGKVKKLFKKKKVEEKLEIVGEGSTVENEEFLKNITKKQLCRIVSNCKRMKELENMKVVRTEAGKKMNGQQELALKGKKKKVKERIADYVSLNFWPVEMLIPQKKVVDTIRKFFSMKNPNPFFKISFIAEDGQTANGRIFLFDSFDENLVVSDIDGTITNSRITKAYLNISTSFPNVCRTFEKIEKNGYRMIYLTHRYLSSMEKKTRKFLYEECKEMSDDEKVHWRLPTGPVIFSMDNAKSSFVIWAIGKEDDFKAFQLSVIRSLFAKSPYHAGFGNTERDFKAYKRNGVKYNFIINPKGDISCKFNSKPCSDLGNSIECEVFSKGYKEVDVGKIFPRRKE